MTVREWFRGMRDIPTAINVENLLAIARGQQPRPAWYRWPDLHLILIFEREAYERKEWLHALIEEGMRRAMREILSRDLAR